MFREHVSTHTLPFHCTTCTRRFSSNFGLKRHRDTCPWPATAVAAATTATAAAAAAPAGRPRRRRGPHAAPAEQAALHDLLNAAGCVDDMVGILLEWQTGSGHPVGGGGGGGAGGEAVLMRNMGGQGATSEGYGY